MCFLQDNFEYYISNLYYSQDTFKKELTKIKQELLVKNCIYITVEERNKYKLERISFKVSYVDEDGRGILFYNSDGEEIFRYNHKKSLGFYYNSNQKEEYILIEGNCVDYPEEWLEWVVDYAYQDYFHKAQNWFGTDSDLIMFCDKLYMSKDSRLKLKELVILKKMSNFKDEYGYENSILKEQLRNLYVL